MCTHICLFKGNLQPECERITPFHSVASGEKYQTTSLIKNRLLLRALKYIYLKATYWLRIE